MRRVLVIGPGGAGKSTFSEALARRTGLPLVHLDGLYWSAGWVPTPPDAWDATVRELIGRDRWILDGNYGGTMAMRLEAADTIVFLDEGRLRCLWRVVRRRLRWSGRSRPSMPEGCPERLTLDFLVWIWSYPRRRRPGILRMLDGVSAVKRVVVLRGGRAVSAFLDAAADDGPIAGRQEGDQGAD